MKTLIPFLALCLLASCQQRTPSEPVRLTKDSFLRSLPRNVIEVQGIAALRGGALTLSLEHYGTEWALVITANRDLPNEFTKIGGGRQTEMQSCALFLRMPRVNASVYARTEGNTFIAEPAPEISIKTGNFPGGKIRDLWTDGVCLFSGASLSHYGYVDDQYDYIALVGVRNYKKFSISKGQRYTLATLTLPAGWMPEIVTASETISSMGCSTIPYMGLPEGTGQGHHFPFNQLTVQ